jgi:hypothetical protein
MRNVTHAEASEYKTVQSPGFKNAAEFGKLKLAAFSRHCRNFAERVAIGQLRLIDAADMLQSAAELSGLCDLFSEDVIQQIMADAFVGQQERGSE